MEKYYLKRHLSKLFIFGLLTVMAVTSFADGALAANGNEKHQFHRIDPYEAVTQMGAGWNLGNTLDAIPTEGSWNNPPVTADTFDNIRAAGFQSVRIPVTWTHHIGPAPDYAVDPVWMDRVSDVVDIALKRGFYVVLNVHHDSWEWANLSDKSNLEEKQLQLQVLWKQIANRFKNRSERLMFETLNEPQGSTSEDAEQYNIMNRNLLKIIRSTGGHNKERLIILPGLNTNIEKTINWFKNPDPSDKNLIMTVHNYDPWGFVSNWYGITNWNNRSYFDQLFGQLDAFSRQIGLPVIIGEYGTLALGTVETHSKLIYTDSFVRAAHKYGMATMVWDIGFDLFDRQNKEWIYPILRDTILNASKGIANSFVDRAALYVKDGTEMADQVLQLELNGNQLADVFNGDVKLREGIDYVLSGSALTLKKEYVSSFLQGLGVGAQLRFKFSNGADQTLDLIKYKTPELAITEVTIDKGAAAEDLIIPTNFNGTTLATVTALEMNTIDYQTGKPLPMPVKNEWTNWMPDNAFDGLHGGLDYNDDFRSDSNNIYISKNLLNMMNDDTVLSFKFWPRDQEVNVNVVVHVK